MDGITISKIESCINLSECIFYSLLFESDLKINDEIKKVFVVLTSSFLYERFSLKQIKNFIRHICILPMSDRKKYIMFTLDSIYSISCILYFY